MKVGIGAGVESMSLTDMMGKNNTPQVHAVCITHLLILYCYTSVSWKFACQHYLASEAIPLRTSSD